MTRSSLFRRLVLLPGLLIVATAVVGAQFSGAIQGTITDAQKAVVAGAVVIATHTASGVTREATTSDEGSSGSQPGPGTIGYRWKQDSHRRRENIVVGITESVRADVTPEVSGVQETVTVTGGTSVVETERAACPVASTACNQEMPLSGRNLQPDRPQPGVTGKGVSASISGGGGADDSFAGESAPRINASGQRDEANSYTVDDTSTNGVARGGITNLTPNTESVEQVRVVANNFSAVDGRSTGAQVQVITKAGTNQFRGSGSYPGPATERPMPG
jgi:hypothetical protein